MQKPITDYIGKFFSPFLCGYRKGSSTQYALLSLTERWRLCLDKLGCAVALLMDLSKALDAINHELLLKHLKFYYVTHNQGEEESRSIQLSVL